MARLNTLPGIEVSVVVGETTNPPTHEYADPDGMAERRSGNPRTRKGVCSRYVESVDDGRFAFLVRATPEAMEEYVPERRVLHLHVRLDGVDVSGVYFQKWCHRPEALMTGGYPCGSGREEEFRFAPVQAGEWGGGGDARRWRGGGALTTPRTVGGKKSSNNQADEGDALPMRNLGLLEVVVSVAKIMKGAASIAGAPRCGEISGENAGSEKVPKGTAVTHSTA
jgi:hypothetical protein